ncbi:MAG: hypothetical protein ABFS18_07810 [Thermodesulfobacteriota bacterium]
MKKNQLGQMKQHAKHVTQQRQTRQSSDEIKNILLAKPKTRWKCVKQDMMLHYSIHLDFDESNLSKLRAKHLPFTPS